MHDPLLRFRSLYVLTGIVFRTVCRTWSVSLLIYYSPDAIGQPIYPDLERDALIEKLRQDYTPKRTLGYDRGRDALYTKIDNIESILTGIYSGYQVPFDPEAAEPRKLASTLGFNAEHIYPQSKGAKGQSKSDLHHLFASHKEPNGFRGNLPFGRISDDAATDWFCGITPSRGKPAQPEDCSQSSPVRFEPRREVRGVVARAMFYFYTIYQNQADQADPGYFWQQVAVLCRWHRKHPPSEGEIKRSHRVAALQCNDNPFVLDPTAAERAYCLDIVSNSE